MNSLVTQTMFLDTVSGAVEFAFNWLLQSTLLISVGLIVGALMKSRGSAVQSAIYRTTLVAVLLCPLATWLLSLAGVSGWSVSMPSAWNYAEPEQLSTLEEEFFAVALEPVAIDEDVAQYDEASTPWAIDELAPRDDPANFSPGDFFPAGQETNLLDEPTPGLEAPPVLVPPEVSVAEISRINLQTFGMVATAVALLWCLAAAGLLTRLLVAWSRLTGIRRRAAQADVLTLDTCRDLARKLEVAAPDVLCSPSLPSPCLAGLNRPAVLLPDEELQLSLRDVLIHELAHLRRHDCHWNLLRKLATSIFFFQPMLWLLSRRLETTAEEVCDDFVVQLGGDRQQYAHRLVDIVELSSLHSSVAGVGIVSLRSMLAKRVERILDTSRSLSTRIGNLLLIAVLMGGLVGTTIVGFVGVGRQTSNADAETPAATEATGESEAPDEATNESASDEQRTADEETEFVTLRGHVVDENGLPISDATIQTTHSRWIDVQAGDVEHQVLQHAVTDNDGAFTVTVPKVDNHNEFQTRLPQYQWRAADLIATAPGFAPSWVRSNEGAYDRDVVIRLSRQSATIRGRLVNLEGQPIVGVQVRPKQLAHAEPDDVEQWLEDVESLRADGKLPSPATSGMLSMFVATTAATPAEDPQITHRRQAYYPGREFLTNGHPLLPPAVQTDEQGRFEITGFAPDQLATLEISGQGFVQHDVTTVTREMESLRLANATYYGATFDHPVAPGCTIIGTVKDIATGEPLAGATVTSYLGAGSNMSIERRISSVTDSTGRFRIEGMPIGKGNLLKVLPPVDEPYLISERHEVPETDGTEPVDMEIELRRGVFVTGRVTDAETGEPVDATVHFHPFLDNTHARDYARFDPNRFRGPFDPDERGRIVEDGSFRIVAIPGRAILAAYTVERGRYCVGLGAEEIEGLDSERQRFATYDHCSPRIYHRLVELNIPVGAAEIEQDLKVHPGSKIRIKAVDPDGNLLTGIRASNRTPAGSVLPSSPDEAAVEILALRPGEKRPVLLLHHDRRLGQVIEVQAPENTADTELPPVTLQPCGEVVGRMVNGDGEPVSGAEFWASLLPSGDMGINAESVVTQGDGSFHFRYLAPGGRYRLLGSNQEVGFVELISQLEFEPGEKIDIGTIDVTSDERPEPTRMVATRAAQGTTRVRLNRDSDPALTDNGSITVRGRVLDPEGKPLSGANVKAIRINTTQIRWEKIQQYVGQTTTGDDGSYEMQVDSSADEHLGDSQFVQPSLAVLATAPGLAPDFQSIGAVKSGDPIDLQLAEPGTPIEGRVLDIEGQPIAGIRVSVRSISAPRKDRDLTDWIEKAQHNPRVAPDEMMMYSASSSSRPQIARFPAEKTLNIEGLSLVAECITGNDGRFEFTGLGTDRLVSLEIAGPSIAIGWFDVVTRDMEPLPNPSHDPRVGAQVCFGANFDYVASPTRIISGVVRDADSGEPLPGLNVAVYQFRESLLNVEGFVSAVTDEAGRYRLVGLPKANDEGRAISLRVIPDEKSPYFRTEVEVPKSGGLDTTRFDIDLKRAVWLTGQVTDKETGEPVQALVSYYPFLDNDYAKNYVNFNPGLRSMGYGDRYPTTDSGTFRIPAIHGRGIFTAIALDAARYQIGDGAESIDGLRNEERMYVYHLHGPELANAVREVTIPPGADEASADIEVAPLDVSVFQLRDPSEQPLRGAIVQGQYPKSPLSSSEHLSNLTPLTSDAASILGLDHDQQRLVMFLHKEKRLGIAQVLKPGMAGPIELQPCATIKGRLTQGDQPADADSYVSAYILKSEWPEPQDGRGWGRHDVWVQTDTVDEDGHFVLDRIVPGVRYKIQAMGVTREIDVIQPGETIDLGTINFTSDEQSEITQARATLGESAASLDSDTATTANKPSDSTQHITGRVLDPDGKPVAGTNVFVSWVPRKGYAPAERFEHDIITQTKSDTGGAFELKFYLGDRDTDRSRFPWRYAQVVAHAPGMGPAWTLDPDFPSDSPITLQLTRDVAIRGRIVDLEGKPIAGVTARVYELHPKVEEHHVLDWFQQAQEKSPPGELSDYINAPESRYANAFPTRVSSRLADGSPALPAATVTDQDGRFELSQLGENSLAIVELEGPSIAKSWLHVVVREMEPVSAKPLGGRGPHNGIYYGREFLFVADKTQPVEGTVTDAVTGEPLTGVQVRATNFGGKNYLFPDFLTTRTDEAGRYRLVGVPQGGGHGIEAAPIIDQPYFTTEKTISAESTSFAPVTCDFQLRKGNWIVGRVTDGQTGEPIANAVVNYLALRTNEHAADYSNFDPQITGSIPSERIQTDKDGRFRVLAIPGSGVVAAIARGTNNTLYSTITAKQIPDHLLTSNGMLNTYHPYVISIYHALQEVQIPESADEVECNLKLTRAQSRVLKVVDTYGKPVTGVKVLGRTLATDMDQPSEDSEIEILGLQPNVERLVAIVHAERQIGKALTVSTGNEMTVVLEPCAVARGRAVDEDGEPIGGAEIDVWADRTDRISGRLARAVTDDAGRFEVLLPPDTKCRIAYYDPNGARFSADCEPKSGALIELGDLGPGTKYSADQTAEMTVAHAVAPQQSEAESSAETKPDANVLRYAGTVIDAKGKPVAGAKIHFAYWVPSVPPDYRAQPKAVTGADGKFQFTAGKSDFADGETDAWQHAAIVAVADGFGFAHGLGAAFETTGEIVKQLPPQALQYMKERLNNPDRVLKLVADHTPISGRVVNADGQPVVGARVRVDRLWWNESGSLDDWEAAAKDEKADFYSLRTHTPAVMSGPQVASIVPETTSDGQGRFTLPGVGIERVCQLIVSGRGIETTLVKARTRRGEKVVVPHQWRTRNSRPAPRDEVYLGAEFTHVGGPSRPVVGRVTDSDTGRPIAGVSISAGQQGTFFSAGEPYIAAFSDRDGNYRLEGLPVGQQQTLFISPPADSRYLSGGISVETRLDAPELTRNFQLKQGILVRGQATDDRTGEPVLGRVQYHVPLDNPHLEEFALFARGGTMHERRTDAEGRFSISVMPGAGILSFLAIDHSNYRRGLGTETITAPVADGVMGSDAKMFRTQPAMLVSSNEHVLRQIEPEPDAPPLDVTLTLTSGVNVVVRMEDPTGEPVSGGIVSGRVFHGAWYPIRGETFTVEGYYPDRPRELFVFHPQRNLGAHYRLEGSPPEELTLSLEATGNIRGRLIDDDGAPLPGCTLHGEGVPNENYGDVDMRLGTDNEGRFLIRGLLPDRSYSVIARSGITMGEILKDVEVEAGQTTDVGDVKLQESDPRTVFSSPAAALSAAFSEKTDASAPTAESERQPASETPDTTKAEVEDRDVITGRVVDVNGKPVAGAKFYWIRVRVHDLDPLPPRLIVTTNDEGEFRFTPPGLGVTRDEPAAWMYRDEIIVRAEGYGFVRTSSGSLRREMDRGSGVVGAVLSALTGRKGTTIKLPRAGARIRGRIVDIEGQPVVGATVRVRWFNERSASRYQRRDAEARGRENAALTAQVNDLLNIIEPAQLKDVLPMAKTDADGRFELRDIGEGRMVQLLVRGDHIESTEIVSRNDASQTITLEPDRHSDGEPRTVHRRDFVHVVGPSKQVEGQVLDLDTGEPIANAVVRAFRVHGNRLSSSRERQHFATRTDSSGRYRITGLPRGAENELVAFTTGDVPYIPVGHEVDTSQRGATVQQDFRLKRGVWAEGAVFDSETDERFSGEMTYYYFRNQEVEAAFPGVRDAYLDGRYWTGADGSFRVPVLPTRGVLAFRYAGDAMGRDGIDRYPRGYGADSIEGGEKMGALVNFPTRPHYLMPSNYQRVVEVEPADGQEAIHVDMPLVASKTIKVRVVNAAGKPVREYQVYGAADSWGWQRQEQAEFKVVGVMPGENRKLLVFDRDRNIAGSAIVDQQTAGEVAIVLEEAGSITGRLIDRDGEPITDAIVSTNYERLWEEDDTAIWAPHPDLHANATQIPVGKEGRFQVDGLVAGMKYNARASAPRMMRGEMMDMGIGSVFTDVTIEPGEDKDLGDLVVGAESPDESDTSAQNNAAAQQPGATITGQVTDAAGQPVAGTDVAAIAMRTQPSRGGDFTPVGVVLAQAVTDNVGSYTLNFSDVSAKTHQFASVIARKDGAAIAWKQFDPDAKNVEARFQLMPEELIRGRLIDIEGRPAADVQMTVGSVMETSNPANWDQHGTGYRQFENAPRAWLPAITSDDQGRIVVRGVPAGHGVFLEAEGSDRFAPQQITLNSGRPEQRGERDGTYRALVKNVGPGEEALLPLAPAQSFEGTVTYEDTGEPAPYARLTIWASQQEQGGSMSLVAGRADGEGRYRINPHPGVRFGVTAYPPDGTPYLPRRTSHEGIRWEAGYQMKQVDMTLPRGVLVHGKLVEEGTDRPVAGASIQYVPQSLNNPNTAEDILTGWQGIQISDEEGRFEIAVLPGPGQLLVYSNTRNYVLQEVSSRELERGESGGRRKYVHALHKLNPEVGSEPIDATIELQPGAKVVGKIVDEQGRPVDEALVITRLNVSRYSFDWQSHVPPTLGGRFELTGLDPNLEYPVYILDAQRHLGATAIITASDPAPTVVLKPCGTATAKFGDAEDDPDKEVHINLNMAVTPGIERYDMGMRNSGALAADSDFVTNIDRANYWPFPEIDENGRIELPALIPDASYRIRFSSGDSVISKEFSIKSGEILEFGDIRFETEPSVAVQDTDEARPADIADAESMTRLPDHDAVQADTPDASIGPASELRVSGRVVGANGQPVTGVRIFVPSFRVEQPISLDDVQLIERASSDVDGGFQFSASLGGFPERMDKLQVLAFADGYGVAGVQVPRDGEQQEVTLTLAPEQIVRGRILDTEGRPVVGVKLRATIIMRPQEGQLEEFINGWEQGWQDATHRMQDRINVAGSDEFCFATTGEQGEFEIHGIGRERVAWLQLSGAGIAQTMLFAVTRDGVDYSALNTAALERIPNELRLPAQPVQLVGPTFDYFAEPGETIEGTVRDMLTSQPASDMVVISGGGFDNAVITKSDAQGFFRLNGLPQQKTFNVILQPPSDSPYLGDTARVQNTAGLDPIRVDFELPRGVIVTGQVIDRQTGKGMKSSLRIAPLAGNEFFDKPGFDGYRTNRMSESTDRNGNFRLVSMPGPVVLMAQADSVGLTIGDRPVSPFIQASFDADDREKVPVTNSGEDRYFTAADNSSEFLSSQNAVRYLDLDVQDETVECDLYVERGRQVEFELVDDQDNPLAGAVAAGLAEDWPITYQLPDSHCTVLGLVVERPRQVLFYHRERRLAGSLLLDGNESLRDRLQLQSAVRIIGRAVDADGQPLPDTKFEKWFANDTARELERFLKQTRSPLETDAEGRFELVDVVPGFAFRLAFGSAGAQLVSSRIENRAEDAANSVLDLGDVVVQRRR